MWHQMIDDDDLTSFPYNLYFLIITFPYMHLHCHCFQAGNIDPPFIECILAAVFFCILEIICIQCIMWQQLIDLFFPYNLYFLITRFPYMHLHL